MRKTLFALVVLGVTSAVGFASSQGIGGGGGGFGGGGFGDVGGLGGGRQNGASGGTALGIDGSGNGLGNFSTQMVPPNYSTRDLLPYAQDLLQSFDLDADLSLRGVQALQILKSGSAYPDFETFGLATPADPWDAKSVPVFTPGPKHCLDCQPADPEIGLANVGEITGIVLPKRLQEALSAQKAGSTDSSQLNEIKQCGSAVQMLRAPISSVFGNMIDDFHQGCLKPDKGEYKALDTAEKREISRCLVAHTLYEEGCLQDTETIISRALVARIGMLFNVTAESGAEPACTATLVTETLIVTARHCYVREALKLPSDYGSVSGKDVLVYAVNPNLSSTAPVQVSILGEVTENGLRDVELLEVYPDPSDDIIILRLAVPLPIDRAQLEIKWGKAQLGSQLTLIGFQALAFREALLRDRVRNAAIAEAGDLLAKQLFVTYLKSDHRPMCIVGDEGEGYFGHFCQSFGGASGAPIFLGDLSNPGSLTVTIVGFQSRGDPSDVPDKENAGPTNTAAQINEGVAKVLGLKD